MAEVKKAADQANWADMEHEDEDDQEIGLQQKQPEAVAGEEQKEGAAEGTPAEGESKYPPRKRKDYGDKYNPNYKKGPWRKGQQWAQPEGGDKKNFAPPQPRTKTERGDYVVTSFQIPDRTSGKGDTKELTEGDKKKTRRVGAFQIDDSDLEEEEQQAVAEQTTEEPVTAVVEEKKEVAVAAPVVQQKALSKKEQKKRELEELEALLGDVPATTAPATTATPVAQTKPEESKEGAGESKKKKKAKKAKEEGE